MQHQSFFTPQDWGEGPAKTLERQKEEGPAQPGVALGLQWQARPSLQKLVARKHVQATTQQANPNSCTNLAGMN